VGLSDLQFLELDAEIDLSNFDCGDDDITNWLKEDIFDNIFLFQNHTIFGESSHIVVASLSFELNDVLNENNISFNPKLSL